MGDDAELIHHPQHYNAAGPRAEDGTAKFEAIKIIESWGFGVGFCLGSAVKYIIRAPHKGTAVLDLEKALWYLRRLTERAHVESERPEESMDPMDPLAVAEAWGLSRELTTALLNISCCNVEAATAYVSKELALIRVAQAFDEALKDKTE